MRILKKILQYNMGAPEMRSHALTRQAAKYSRKPLKMKQLKEISQKRHQPKDGK